MLRGALSIVEARLAQRASDGQRRRCAEAAAAHAESDERAATMKTSDPKTRSHLVERFSHDAVAQMIVVPAQGSHGVVTS
jgi:hypothetical protein